MNNEKCIQFENKQGHRLRGILHHAETVNNKKVTLICLNTGLNDMVGWHRLQVKIARFLASQGYNVLRFDNFGIGDSEGEIEEGEVTSIMTQIEQGMWADDAICALDFMMDKFKEDRFYFIGFCGGALNAIHAAAKDQRISGIINVAAPVFLTTNVELKVINPFDVKKNVESLKRKIFNIKSVINFLSGKSDYHFVFKSLYYYIQNKIHGQYRQTTKADEQQPINFSLNKSFFDSFKKFSLQKKPSLFYYAEYDKATWELKKYFIPRFEKTTYWKNYCTFIVLKDSNHIFSDVESQQSMKNDILNWLNGLD